MVTKMHKFRLILKQKKRENAAIALLQQQHNLLMEPLERPIIRWQYPTSILNHSLSNNIYLTLSEEHINSTIHIYFIDRVINLLCLL